MSKSRNRKKGNKTKKVNEKFNNEIIGIVIIGLGILIMVSLFSQQMGIIGKLIKKTSLLLMGLGSYIFPIFIIGTGIIFILDKYSKKELKISLIALIIFLSFLVLLDSSNISSQGFINRIRMANKMSASNKGGGVIGAFLGFFFYNLFGKIGGYLILLITLIVTLMILMEVRLKDIINYVKKFISKKSLVRSSKGIEKNGNFKKENKIKKKDNKKKSTERIINKNRNIKILEYKEQSKGSKKSVEASQENGQLVKSGNNKIQYKKPPLKLLNDNISKKDSEGKKEILNNAKIIEDTMSNFGIDASVTQINKGPTVTCYELSPSPGIKLSRIVSLDDNIALSLAASDIRIEAPIPGKAAVGIEVPNKIKDNVFLKEMLLSGEFKSIESDIPLTLGKDVSGQPIITSIDKMPHLLIAGATGSGKSVCINTIITSIVYKSSPDKVKLLLIDPKVVELSIYNDIPHLLIPVVTDSKKAASALNWAVEEMERRYKSFAKYGARDIHGYNEKIRKLDGDKVANEIPRIVIIIDELADLMMVAAQEIEDYISRLAQKARAAGMYLIVATQRPSVDVITGTIKANIPSRLSFAVSSQVDSRTILDMGGAEKLLGHGDMLFFPSHYSKPLRIQGTFVSDNEIEKIVDFLKNNYQKEYDEEVIDIIENEKDLNLDDTDELLEDAIELVVAEEQASISMLQRRLRIGYARAARLVDEMELRGIVGGHEGSKPRKVLISKEDMENLD